MINATPMAVIYAQTLDVPKMIQNGIFLFNQRKYDDAIKAFDKVLGFEPNNTYVLNQKGVALYILGKNEEAVKVFDESLAIDPNNTRALNSKGLLSCQN
jgi:tetratricopeptide (TPR) repeat protein